MDWDLNILLYNLGWLAGSAIHFLSEHHWAMGALVGLGMGITALAAPKKP